MGSRLRNGMENSSEIVCPAEMSNRISFLISSSKINETGKR